MTPRGRRSVPAPRAPRSNGPAQRGAGGGGPGPRAPWRARGGSPGAPPGRVWERAVLSTAGPVRGLRTLGGRWESPLRRCYSRYPGRLRAAPVHCRPPHSCVSLLPWGRMAPEPGEAVSGSQPGEHHKAVLPRAKRTSLPRSGSTGGRSVASAWSGSVPNRNSPRGCAKSTGQPSRVYSSSGLIPTQISSNSVHLYLGTALLIKTLWTGH